MIEQFEIVEKEEQPVLCIRTVMAVGNLPQEIGKAYQAIAQHMAMAGHPPKDAPYTAYYNMDMEHLDVEMGFPLDQPLDGKDNIQAGSIPAGKQASCMYKGSYSNMGPVYEEFAAKITESGHTPTGVSYEFYYNSPGEVPESELLTKIMFPLK